MIPTDTGPPTILTIDALQGGRSFAVPDPPDQELQHITLGNAQWIVPQDLRLYEDSAFTQLSDIVRFVNVGGMGQIYFKSDTEGVPLTDTDLPPLPLGADRAGPGDRGPDYLDVEYGPRDSPACQRLQRPQREREPGRYDHAPSGPRAVVVVAGLAGGADVARLDLVAVPQCVLSLRRPDSRCPGHLGRGIFARPSLSKWAQSQRSCSIAGPELSRDQPSSGEF